MYILYPFLFHDTADPKIVVLKRMFLVTQSLSTCLHTYFFPDCSSRSSSSFVTLVLPLTMSTTTGRSWYTAATKRKLHEHDKQTWSLILNEWMALTCSLDAYVPSWEERRIVHVLVVQLSIDPIQHMTNPQMRIRDIDYYVTSCWIMCDTKSGVVLVMNMGWQSGVVPDTGNRLDMPCSASCHSLCIKVPYNASSIMALLQAMYRVGWIGMSWHSHLGAFLQLSLDSPVPKDLKLIRYLIFTHAI